MGARVRCLTPELGVMAGYAVTATCDSMTPGQPRRREPFMALWDALAAAPKPAVLVFQDVSPTATHSVHLGDVMATIGARLGAIGLVTDGAVRDLEGIRPLRFHLFGLGVAPSHGTFNVVDVGVPVTVDGVRIAPGDLIHADANGVTTIPLEIADRGLRAVPEGARAGAHAPRVRDRQGLHPRGPARARPRPVFPLRGRALTSPSPRGRLRPIPKSGPTPHFGVRGWAGRGSLTWASWTGRSRSSPARASGIGRATSLLLAAEGAPWCWRRGARRPSTRWWPRSSGRAAARRRARSTSATRSRPSPSPGLDRRAPRARGRADQQRGLVEPRPQHPLGRPRGVGARLRGQHDRCLRAHPGGPPRHDRARRRHHRDGVVGGRVPARAARRRPLRRGEGRRPEPHGPHPHRAPGQGHPRDDDPAGRGRHADPR